jgi:cell division septation protein DedD
LRLRTFHFVILVVVMTLAVKVANGFAFSFGGIDIHSKFGERFDAELDVLLEEDGELQVQIGDANDYRRLDMDRPTIIDDLIIEPPPDSNSRRKTVRVYSKRPLFYPSFHLIVRGTFKGGTLLERYLVTVDFQQSLALNVVGKERNHSEESLPVPVKKVDLLDGGGAAVEPSTAQGIEKEQEGVASDSETSSLETFAKTGLPDKPSRVNAPSWMAKPPSHIMGKRGEESYFPGATWVSPTLSIPPMPPMDPPRPQSADDIESSPDSAEKEPLDSPVATETESSVPPELNRKAESSELSYGPLTKGESLLAIAAKLNAYSANGGRIAAAIWMDNPESFLYGNMNGLKAGSQINLENLEKRLEEIDSTLAEQILRSQHQEWKIIQNKSASQEGMVGEGMQEIPLPLESEEEKKMIFEMLQKWKTSWESGDLDQHLALLSNQNNDSFSGGIANLRFLKKRMFARHKNIKLGIKQASLVLKGGQPVVSFGQSFSSGTMESYGRKDVGVVRENGAWKILREKFKVDEYLEKPEASPEGSATPSEEIFLKERKLAVAFTIHVSSHLDYRMATQAVNELRKSGFNAYSSPVNISRSRKIYRVYAGRFASIDLAKELVSELRKYDIAKLAIPVKKPYAFLMGEYDQEVEAETLILNLRSMGLSPLLFTFSEKEFLDPKFQVLLGAFTTKADAAQLSDELTARQLSFKLMAP